MTLRRLSLLTSALAVAALAFAGATGAAPREVPLKTSFSIDYTDLWWNPSQSGWGLQMVQTGSFIYVTIYVYGADGKPTWFGGGLSGNAGGSFTGTLYVTSGPWYGVPFNPAAVTVREAGTMAFAPANAISGLFSYTIDGVAVAKAVQRQPITLDNYNGTYSGVVTQTLSGCNDAARNGNSTGDAAITISQNGSAAVVTTSTALSGTCTSTGVYSQYGRMGQLVGTYTCGSGDAGTMALTEMNNVPYMFTAKLQAQSSKSGCATNGEMSGVIPR